MGILLRMGLSRRLYLCVMFDVFSILLHWTPGGDKGVFDSIPWQDVHHYVVGPAVTRVVYHLIKRCKF